MKKLLLKLNVISSNIGIPIYERWETVEYVFHYVIIVKLNYTEFSLF